MSIDVNNQFTSILISETLTLVSSHLYKNNVRESIRKFCLLQHFIIFNNKYYAQIDGSTIGCTLFYLLAIWAILRTTLINKFNKVKHYFKYVDVCSS